MCSQSGSFHVARQGPSFHQKAEKGVNENSDGVSGGQASRFRYQASMAECSDPGSG